MNDPTEIEMAQTREILARSPKAFLEAVAMHHSRVARLAVDMRKMVDSWEYSVGHTIEHTEQMSRIIENSFARAFGVKLRAAPMTETSEAKE